MARKTIEQELKDKKKELVLKPDSEELKTKVQSKSANNIEQENNYRELAALKHKFMQVSAKNRKQKDIDRCKELETIVLKQPGKKCNKDQTIRVDFGTDTLQLIKGFPVPENIFIKIPPKFKEAYF